MARGWGRCVGCDATDERDRLKDSTIAKTPEGQTEEYRLKSLNNVVLVVFCCRICCFTLCRLLLTQQTPRNFFFVKNVPFQADETCTICGTDGDYWLKINLRFQGCLQQHKNVEVLSFTSLKGCKDQRRKLTWLKRPGFPEHQRLRHATAWRRNARCRLLATYGVCNDHCRRVPKRGCLLGPTRAATIFICCYYRCFAG